MEIAENGIRYEKKETPGRKKIESFTINIVQLIPNSEEEINLIRQEISFFLQKELEDSKLVLRLMQPWNSKDIDLATISKLKKKIDSYPSLLENNQIRNPKGWIISAMDPKKIHEDIMESIISNSNSANSKWNETKDLIKERGKSKDFIMIENVVIHNYVEESNTLDFQMISESTTYLQFLMGQEFYDIICGCIKEVFGNNVLVNIVMNRNGQPTTHPYIS